VAAGRHVRQHVHSGSIRRGCADVAGVLFAKRDCDAGEHGVAFVADRPLQRRGGGLGRCERQSEVTHSGEREKNDDTGARNTASHHGTSGLGTPKLSNWEGCAADTKDSKDTKVTKHTTPILVTAFPLCPLCPSCPS